MLSGYTQATGIYMNQQYFDTGVIATGDTEIKCQFLPLSNSSGYIFGVRNSNSATSTGQYNYYYSQTGTNYFGYNNNRSSFNGGASGTMLVKCFTKKENFESIDSTGFIRNTNRTYASFQSNDTVIVGGMRNGSSITAYPSNLIMCDFYIDGKHFIPAVENETNTAGFVCDDTFIPCGIFGYVKLSVVGGDGGSAFIRDISNNEITEIYTSYFSLVQNIPIEIYADADKDYNFTYWEDNNGNRYYDNQMSVIISSDTTYTAHFEKVVDMGFNVGYHILSINYKNSTISQLSHTYSSVIDAQIVVDSTQKPTTTITLDSNIIFELNTPVFLYDPRGKIVFSGIIVAQNDNVLTCREPLAIFDFEYLFNINTSSRDNRNLTKYVADYVFYHYMKCAYLGSDATAEFNNANLYRRMLYNAFIFAWQFNPSLNNLTYFEKTLPLISQKQVGNLEDYLLDLSNNYYVYPDMKLIKGDGVNGELGMYYAQIKPYTSAQIPTLVFGTNVDAISNLSIVEEDPEYTVLVIYNSSGSTFRAIYAIATNGEIVDITNVFPETSYYFAYKNYNVKIEMTDDTDITPIANDVVSSGQYNHKIDFTLDLNNNFYDIDTFKVGQRVAFYNGNKLYDSIVTGLKYNVESNQDTIKKVDITLGNVRQSLTSKILIQGKKK